MINRVFTVVLLLSALLASSVFAAESKVSADVEAKILTELKAARPDFKYGEIVPTPIKGLYGVQIEQGPMLFVSEDGRFALTGNLYGVAPGGFIDMQELAMAPKRKAALEAVANKDKIIFPAVGDTKAFVTVFTDVDCGFCRKLHQEVPAMNAKGIEVRYMAFPRAGINSASYDKIAKAWCADDRNDALTRLKNGQTFDGTVCDNNPVAEHFKLGGELGVRGTPAIILEDGALLPGYMTAGELAQVLKIGS